MYQSFFGLNSKPFGIVPDTRFLFMSDSHKEAIAHLVYALNEKNGFVQLTGEVGVGKTMACRYILANIPKDIDLALILNPRVDEIGLLKTLCTELSIAFKTERANELTTLISEKLLKTHAAGRHTILIIDEAQNLPKRTLEQIRLLTNLETDTQKLLRIIMIGQPELGDLLAQHDMRQVAQRITSRYHLQTLAADETNAYIHHRLKVAGCDERLFNKAAVRKIHKLTKGTPRLINLLCDRALIGAYSLGVKEITPAIIKTAAKEALPLSQAISQPLAKLGAARQAFTNGSHWYLWLGAGLLIAAVLLAFQADSAQWFNQFRNGVIQNTALNKNQSATNKQAKLSAQDLRTNQTRPSLTLPSAETIERLKTQHDIDFRLGVPSPPR